MIGRKMFDHNEVVIDDQDEAGAPRYLSAGQVMIPDFEVYATPTINISDIKQRRFSLIDRYK